jgi:hypothetical protein
VKPHAFHPDAEGEYADAASYYARINPALGGRFYDEIERLIRDIRQQPSVSVSLILQSAVTSPTSSHMLFFTLIGRIGFGSSRLRTSKGDPATGNSA